MNSGDLRDEIMLQRKQVSRDSLGGQTITWVDVEAVRANVNPYAGREFVAAQQQHSEIDIWFIVRYYETLDNTWRVVWKGKPYNIIRPIDYQGRGVEHHLMCSSQING